MQDYQVTGLDLANVYTTVINKMISKNICFCNTEKYIKDCMECSKIFYYKDLEYLFYDNLKTHVPKEKRTCILNETWLECSNDSCKSHTISKGLNLSTLKLAGKSIYTFDLNLVDDYKNSSYSIKPLSIHRASTFKGFCEKHESIFSPIDNFFNYKDKNHIILLAMRQYYYELSRRIEVINKYKSILSFFEKINSNILNKNECIDLNKIKRYLNKKIGFEKKIYLEIIFHINKIKEIVNINNKKAKINSEDSIFQAFVIKYDGHFDFSFSTGFNLEYSFDGRINFKNYQSFNEILPLTFITLINDKKQNCSYFIGFCDDNKEARIALKNLFNSTKLNIQNTLKCSLTTDNSFYSEDFKNYIENTFDPSYPVEKIHKRFYLIHRKDSQYLQKVNGGIDRITNLNIANLFNIVPKKIILDFDIY